jgi:hypothetical protein
MENVPVQAAWAVILTAITTAMHVLGSGALLVFVRRHVQSFRHTRAWPSLTAALVALVMGLMALHAIEILVFAGVYMAVDAFPDWEHALFFSTANYGTVGAEDLTTDKWRLLGAWEGIVGFVLIGWSTALFITVILRIWSEDHKWFEPRD